MLDVTAQTSNQTKMHQLFGNTAVWVGNEALNWQISDFTAAAKNIKAMGGTSMVPKRADGATKWYKSVAQIQAEKAAVNAEGLAYVPFIYAYGPKFGDANITNECNVLKELAGAAGAIQADMEGEWNGNVTAATNFCSQMENMPQPLSVTILGDPAVQNWNGVISALAPCVDSWVPQWYDTSLSKSALPADCACVQPGVDITNEYGANDPLNIAKPYSTVFLWEYETALANMSLSQAIASRNGPVQGMSMDPSFFTANSDGSYTCKQTGFKIQKGFLTWYENNGGLFRLGLPLNNEYVIPNMGTATIQMFERGALVWDTGKVYDNVPGTPSDSIYFAHINSGEVLKFIKGL